MKKTINGPHLVAAVQRPITRLLAISWRDLLVVLIPILLVASLLGWAAVKLIRPAPPDTLVILGGAEESSFQITAQRYAKSIAAHGIKVNVITTDGSEENLRLLQDKKYVADVGFIQTGLVEDDKAQGLMSLGTLYVAPVMVFYHGKQTLDRLTQFKGKKIAIGPDGSGTNVLAMKMLKENGMGTKDTILQSLDGDDAIKALLAKKVDAIFVMSELTRGRKVRELMQQPGIRLMNFAQADGYLRRLKFMSRLTAPQGSFDLGLNLPPHDVQLVGTPIELVAREELHPAISDLLIAAAREIHGKPGMFRKSGEFPTPVEYEIPLSEEAKRYYAAGAPFLYKRFPFWLASLIDRVLLVLVPLLIVVVPVSRLVTPLYTWRMRSRIYRLYGSLILIEREMQLERTSEREQQIKERLQQIETAVDLLQLPLAFADQLYVLREHIGLVQARFDSGRQKPA